MTYTIEKVRKEFIEVCEKAGSTSVRNVSITANSRLSRTLGRVIYRRNWYDEYFPEKVEFSKRFIESNDEEQIKAVILHEAAHFLVVERTHENHGHDKIFKEVCAELGTTNDQTICKSSEGLKADTKYTVKCEHCKAEVKKYKRKCKGLSDIVEQECPYCHRKALTVIQNW